LERDIKFLKMRYIIITIFISLFPSCNGDKISKEDLVGLWKSEEGSSIYLNADGSCFFDNVDCYNIFSRYKNRVIDFSGSWTFNQERKYGGDHSIEIKTNKILIENDTINYSFSLYIKGTGVFENKKPWIIYKYKGDIDNLDIYKFTFTKK